MNNEYDESLVTDNLGLIHLMIKRMNCKWETQDEYQNYYDYGLEGLIRGAKTYTAAKGNVSTYLCVCIQNSIKRVFYLNGMSKRHNPAGPDLSLNYTINESNNLYDYSEFGDFIPDPNVNVEETVEKKFERERLLNAVNSLENEKDKTIVKMYYGLDGYEEITSYEEIGSKFGISRSAVYFRMNRAKKHLKCLLKNAKDVSIIRETKKEKYMVKKEVTTLADLNSILFEQINKLNDDDCDFKHEILKAKAISSLAQQIVANTNACIKAVKLVEDKKISNESELKLLGLGNANENN